MCAYPIGDRRTLLAVLAQYASLVQPFAGSPFLHQLVGAAPLIDDSESRTQESQELVESEASANDEDRSLRARARAHPDLVALAMLLAVGVVLRVYFMFQWRPSLTG